MTGPGLERVARGQCPERCVAARAAAADRYPPAIYQPTLHQVAHPVDAIVYINHAPLACESLAVRAPEAGTAAIVDIEYREAATRPVLFVQAEHIARHARWAAVTFDNQWRQFALRRGKILVCRRIEKGVGGQAILGRKLDGLWNRDIASIDFNRAGTAQRLRLQRTQVEPDKAGWLGRRTGSKHGLRGRDLYAAERCVGSFNGRQLPRFRIETAQVIDALPHIDTDDAVGSGEPIGRHTKCPLRRAEFSRQLTEMAGLAMLKPIEVPPARAVRGEVQHASGRPCGLEDRFILAACYMPGTGNCAISRELSYPQFAAVPGHIRMIPCQPRQLLSIRAEARRGVKIVAGDQYLYLLTAVQRDTHQRIDRLAALYCVIFAHANQSVALPVNHKIGIAHLLLRRNRLRLRTRHQPVESLVGEIGEVDDALAHSEGAAAIFVNPRARIKWRWQ